MKRLLPVICLSGLIAAALVLPARTAQAAGVNLSWTDCGSAGQADRAFACNTNAGTNILISSFVTPAGIDSANGNEIVIDLQTQFAALPQWWMMKNGGTCRSTALSMSFDFSGGPSTCVDYWAGQALGSFGYTAPYLVYGTNRARVVGVCAIGASSAGPIAVDTEVYSNKLSISNVKSTGLGACAGCTDAACLVLNSIRLTQNQRSATGNISIIGAPGGGRNFATWQGGTGVDCNLVPSKNRTWGQVKSLYR
jgi:hypothetical protein